MNKLFVPYEVALLAKEKGFNEPVFGYYSITKSLFLTNPRKDRTKYPEDTDAPLYQQIVDWFREKHKIEVYPVCIRFNSKRLKGYQYVIISDNYSSFEQDGDFEDYYKAFDEAIKEAFKLIT